MPTPCAGGGGRAHSTPGQEVASVGEGAKCRHCRVRKANRRRGLCWVCYGDPAVKGMYGHLPGGYGNRREADGEGGHLPAEPTPFPPGSEGKIAAMRERFLRRESLFHPGDARPGQSED